MSSQILLSGGDKWYSYSGVVFGDVSVPATIQLINIPNTGIRDSVVQIQPYFGTIVNPAYSIDTALGVEIKLDDITVLKFEQFSLTNWGGAQLTSNESINNYSLFVPRQSKLEIISLTSTQNNTQERGCNLLGYYL